MEDNIIGRAVRVIAALLVALVATFGLTACGDDSDGKGADSVVEDAQDKMDDNDTAEPTSEAEEHAYEGAYDAKFRKWIDEHDESAVEVSGKVGDVISENAFTLVGTGGAEDLLVVGADPVAGLEAGTQVEVTGEVHKAFNLPGVEDDIDVDFEDDAVFKGFDRDPYVEASAVETAMP